MAAPAPVVGVSPDKIVSANFKIEFDGGGEDVEFAVSVTGIQLETRLAEVRQGVGTDPTYSVVDKAPGEVTVTFTQTSLINSFSEWMDLSTAPAAQRKRNINVIPLEADGVTERGVLARLTNCNPRTYTPGDFDGTSQDILTGTMVFQPEQISFIANQG